ncbi:MAG: YvcK family protein [Actinobacteria bacterium]|nr:YvcK family protein [Actinomycetota bacterium]
MPKRPKIVCLGGGTGLPIVLKSLEGFGERVAIVNMVDDGRSSGILRKRYGVPPVGDLRNSLIALATNKEIAEIFDFRFEKGPLSPHSVGNIVLAAHMLLKKSCIKDTLSFFSKLLDLEGKVIAACEEIVELVALTKRNELIKGQVNVSRTRGIRKVWLEPNVEASKEALQYIENADYLIIAPGSLYSSILPVLLTGSIGESFLNSRAVKIWVFNVANERNETFSYRSRDYVQAMRRHFEKFRVNYILFAKQPKKFTKPYRLVKLDINELEEVSDKVIIGDFVNDDEPNLHDFKKLREVWKKIILQEVGN